MADLYPTKTRLRLLQSVADGAVVFAPHENTVLNTANVPPRRVIGETAEMRRAGWITVDFRAARLGSYTYELTDAGREVLAANGARRDP